MSLVPDLPTDIEALQQLIVQQWEEIARLEHDKRELIRLVFGRSSEKRRPPAATGTPGQGYLFLQEIAAEAARLAEQHRTETTVTVAAHQRQKTGRRATFPEHLPVVQTLCELPEGQRACGGCGGALKEFGEDVTRELERVETTVIHEIRRKKYACPQCQQGVVTASWRGRVIEKGLLGPGFLAHVITERFGHHLPYYRLEGKYKSEGLDLSRSVLCESMSRCAELLEPIAEHLRQEVLAAPVIHTDDTPVTLAKSSQGGPREARVWVYLNRDGRHWYDFTESRKRDGPARVFGNYTGYIQADAYGGYDQLFLPGGAIEVGCWSHLRRKCLEAEAAEPELSRAAVDRIRALFQVEEAAAALADEARQRLRQEKARPLVEEFRAWMEVAATQVLPKGPLARAIGYARNQWEALTRYLDDGRLSISNNAAERALRPFAVGRKNWMFFQREGGGRTAAILMSLLMTAKAAEIDLRDYFRDILLRISEPGVPVTDLTPHGWKARFEEEVKARRYEILRKLTGTA